MRKLLIIGAVLLAGCTRAVTSEKPVITYVEKRVQCPSPAERARLKALRPVPLRNSPMPPTAVERNARSQAQLGRYEAEGGYADQVEAAFDRCQK